MDAQPVADIRPDQIAAATEIHDLHMPGWAASDRALDHLREALPDFHECSVLAKVAAVNQLYNARHDRLVEAAEKIADVLLDPPDDPVLLVEKIAPLKQDRGCRWYLSLASKFGHFFVDADHLPIYDAYAIHALRHHFGRLKWAGKGTAYRAFVGYVHVLREHVDPPCSLRQLDRYLWLSGMCRAWQKDSDVQISREARALVESTNPDVQKLLQQLVEMG